MSGPHYLSAQRLQELKDELRNLKTSEIPKIAQQIDDAKQNGDLSENAEYSDAKDRMAFAHGRVAEIEFILSNVSIIPENRTSSTITVGSSFTVDVGGVVRDFTIVGSNEADPAQGKISNESPIGTAFLGHEVGDVVTVTTPIKTTNYTIVEIK